MCDAQTVSDIVRHGNPKKERFLQFLSAMVGLVLMPLLVWSLGVYKDSIINQITLSAKDTNAKVILLRNDVVNNENIRKIERSSRAEIIDARCVEIRRGIKENRDRITENKVKIHVMHNEAP